MKTALITGVTGQDGSYLAELLISKGYEVHGIRRRTSINNTQRIEHICEASQDGQPYLKLHHADMTDTSSILRVMDEVRPDEVYNFQPRVTSQ